MGHFHPLISHRDKGLKLPTWTLQPVPPAPPWEGPDSWACPTGAFHLHSAALGRELDGHLMDGTMIV